MCTAQTNEILTVEDDTAQTELLRRVLESGGFRVHAELSGTGALQYVAEHPVSLVILDLRLPDIDGHEVCAALRKQYNSWTMPVVMLTGLDQPVEQIRGYRTGADVYLTKPYQAAELLQIVGLLLNRQEGPDAACGCYG